MRVLPIFIATAAQAALLAFPVLAAEPAAAPAPSAGAPTSTPAAPPAAAANPLDDIPDAMPFNTPYGAPITLSRAQAAVQAGIDAATKRNWQISIAVLDSGGNLVAFARMDGGQLVSVKIAQQKADTAVRFRRPTKVFEDAIQKKGFNYLLTIDSILASRGGIPLIEDGKLIGAIGCSGGTGSQDEAVCTAGAATINK